MENHEIIDLAIIGGGPAGLSAALYAQRALLDSVLIEKEAVGGQTILTSKIDNYPGVPHTDGFTLSDLMRTQAEELGAKIVADRVTSLSHDSGTGIFTITADAAEYHAKTVIVAGGATPRHAGFVGEDTYSGHGISYCATCDGMFYRGKRVFVIGGGNSACEEALFLTRFASQVTVIVRKDHLRAQAVVAKELEENSKVDIRYLTSIIGVEGNTLLTGITFKNNETGETWTERYDEGSFGIFVFVGRDPETSLVADLAELDAQGYAITDDRMATRTPGLFCAGDMRAKPLRQIITAAADGAIAATSAASFLGQPIEG